MESPCWEPPTTLGVMWSKRAEVDYALQRHNSLQALRRPQRALGESDPCDADPVLLHSAANHGEPTNSDCPACSDTKLVNLRYVFGEQLGQYSGRIKASAELVEMQHQYGEFKVCVVEVCTECGWNHMITTYLLGDGTKRRPPRRQQTAEDIYG
jgi:hypothetical protein